MPSVHSVFASKVVLSIVCWRGNESWDSLDLLGFFIFFISAVIMVLNQGPNVKMGPRLNNN